MVNVPRIHCHSALKHYEMYHWDCGGDTYNTTYNFNGGSIFGSSFGGGFWNGVGMGLGASIMNLLGFGGGGCFGGGWGAGMPMFGGGFSGGWSFPSINTWWGGSAGGGNTNTNTNSTTITGGSTTTIGGNTAVYKSNPDKEIKRINGLIKKVNEFVDKYNNDKKSGKLNEKKALNKATKLYNEFPAVLENDNLKPDVKAAKKRLAQLFPDLATKYEEEYNEKPGAVQQRVVTGQGVGNEETRGVANPAEEGENTILNRIKGADDINDLIELLDDDSFDYDRDAKNQTAFNAKFNTLLNTYVETNKTNPDELIADLNGIKAKLADCPDLLQLVNDKLNELNNTVLPVANNENDDDKFAIGNANKKIDDIADADDLAGLTKEQARTIGNINAVKILNNLGITANGQINECAAIKEVLFLLEVSQLNVKIAYNAHSSATDHWISGVISNVEEDENTHKLSYKIDCSGRGTQGNKYTVEQQDEKTFRFSIKESDDFGTGVHLADDNKTFVYYEYNGTDPYLYRNGPRFTSKQPR